MEKLTTWIKAERGRLTKLAGDLKITPGAIAQWEKVPAERLGEVCRATGIPMRDLRPDLFEGTETPA